jgi:hypothetical protein
MVLCFTPIGFPLDFLPTAPMTIVDYLLPNCMGLRGWPKSEEITIHSFHAQQTSEIEIIIVKSCARSGCTLNCRFEKPHNGNIFVLDPGFAPVGIRFIGLK